MILLTILASQWALATAPEVWVGHQVVIGKRDLPLLGEVETRTSTLLLARVTRTSNGEVHLEQRACAVDFAEQKGVRVEMPASTVQSLPTAKVRLLPEGGGRYRAQPWEVAWDASDIDGDGQPGATVQVYSTLCGGQLQVASSAVSAAEGELTANGFAGWISVELKQDVLGASGWCLSLASKDAHETQMGRVVYERVDPDTTCSDLHDAASVEEREP